MFFLLILLFIVFNGTFTLEILLFGIGISLAVTLFVSVFTNYDIKKELKIMSRFYYVIAYILVLLVEIIKANLGTMKFVIKGNKSIEPAIVSFDSPLKTEFASTVLANSITLTPGTISVSMRDGKFKVHCLDRSMYEGIDSSVFVRLLKKLEK